MSGPALIGLAVAGDADAWREAGFAVGADGVLHLGQVAITTGVGESVRVPFPNSPYITSQPDPPIMLSLPAPP